MAICVSEYAARVAMCTAVCGHMQIRMRPQRPVGEDGKPLPGRRGPPPVRDENRLIRKKFKAEPSTQVGRVACA